MNHFGLSAACLRLQKPVLLGLQHHGSYIKYLRSPCRSASSKDEDKSSSKLNPENKETQAVQHKMGKWTPRRRRASLSPTDRLYIALSEEADGSVKHVSREYPRNSQAERGDIDFESCRPSPTDEVSKVTSEPPKHVVNEEEQNKLHHDTQRRRRHLSPLKRFSGMIPEKYWNEENVSASVKKDLHELIKHDDPSKK